MKESRDDQNSTEKKNKKSANSKERTVWHPAFCGAIKLELLNCLDILEFSFEHQLNREPLKIDAVIKKISDAVIDKNFAVIFRTYNVVEYKSPNVTVSIYDYYKAQCYCWLYALIEHVAITDMSMTMVVTKRHRQLLKDLQGQFGITSTSKGIYAVNNGAFPVQIVIISELSEDENLWLTSLKKNLAAEQLKRVDEKANLREKDPVFGAYFDVVFGTNFGTYKELKGAKDMKTFTQHLKEMGLIDKWLAKGRVEGRVEGHLEGHLEGLNEGLNKGLNEGLV
ncbi:MAG: hypothetical protein LBL39_05380, partial [Planctomycetaceae bacterium]|nr:hypothetical protein [Planctomycetaceae bacterium]